MNINITITGDTNHPDVQNLLSYLAKVIPGTISVQEEKTEASAAPVTPVKPIAQRRADKKVPEEKTENPVIHNGTPVVEETKEAPEEKTEAPKHSAEQVRAAAVKKSASGKREEVKALIESFGTPNLAGLKPEQFDEFMEKLDAI